MTYFVSFRIISFTIRNVGSTHRGIAVISALTSWQCAGLSPGPLNLRQYLKLADIDNQVEQQSLGQADLT